MQRLVDGQCSVYIGANAGNFLLQEIKKAKSSILVISPYLSSDYIHLLAKKAAQGIKVTALTQAKAAQDMNAVFRAALRQDINIDEKAFFRRKTGVLLAKASIFSSILLPFFILKTNVDFNSALKISLCLFSFGLLLLSFAKKIKPISYSYSEFFDFYTLNHSNGSNGPQNIPFVHAKIYVIDGHMAFIGSANLTWSGLHKNFEAIARFDDEYLCKSIENEAGKLIKYASRLQADLTGPKVYQESW